MTTHVNLHDTGTFRMNSSWWFYHYKHACVALSYLDKSNARLSAKWYTQRALWSSDQWPCYKGLMASQARSTRCYMKQWGTHSSNGVEFKPGTSTLPINGFCPFWRVLARIQKFSAIPAMLRYLRQCRQRCHFLAKHGHYHPPTNSTHKVYMAMKYVKLVGPAG